jgi:uncharacterized protein (DUF885 family)
VRQASKLACQALEEHKSWLEASVLPEAKGSWVLGSKNYERIRELRQSPLAIPEMENLAQRFLQETRKKIMEVTEQIVPGGAVEDALEKVQEDRPADFEGVMQAYQEAMQATREFILEKDLATIPPDEKLHLLETPPHLRPFFPGAAYTPPAKYDPVQEGIFYVTPPTVDGRLQRSHNYGNIQFTAVHEGYPGHHLQFVCSLRAASFAKALADEPVETVEGWALYCEWMMQEHRFAFSPAARFAQLKYTLMRVARVFIDIQMGTGRMSVKEAAEYLVREAYLEESRAKGEAQMYTGRPGYFTGYLVGAHLITQLKKQAIAYQGKDFNERAFHDLLLSSAFLTIPAIEQRMKALDWLPESP